MSQRPMHRPLAAPRRAQGGGMKSAGAGGGSSSPELIANGAFADGTGWSLGAGWSVAGGLLVATAVAAAGSPAASTTYVSNLAQGAFYTVTYTTATTTLGSVTFQLTGGATVSGTTRSTDGTFTETVCATANHTGFQFIAITDYTATIDNVSVRRVG